MPDRSDSKAFIAAVSLVVLGVSSTMLVDAVRYDIAKNKCAKAHNVFTCEFHSEWVPVREASQ